MAEQITMPRLSDTMEEGTVVKWHKNVGDKVSEGDVLADIETDKAIQEFESEFDGVLLYQGVKEGESAPVDAVLAVIGEKGEKFSIEEPAENKTEQKTEQKTEVKPAEVSATQKTQPTSEIPQGVSVVTMPRLSDTMEEGTVAKWHKKIGDQISEGDILADIETDKAVQEFESEDEGTLLYIGAEEGNSMPVEAILAIIGPKGADVSGIVAGFGKEEKPKEEKTAPVAEKIAEPTNNQETKAETATADGGRIFASPLAKKLADEKGIDLSQIKGSGDGGRIVKKDIENYKPAEKAATVSAPSAVFNFNAGEDSTIPNSQMRKVIAKRLGESKFTAPHYYLNIEIDMENCIDSRNKIKAADSESKISYNDIVVKACAMALRKHPQVNSSWTDQQIIIHGNINIGVAVAVEDGLLVPVINSTDFKTLSEISTEVRYLAGRARERKINANEMEGSTFTVSNLGMFGIESFTSIINQPNSCILSVGAIIEKPVVKNGEIAVGNTMKLSLACDHRTVDGATGAKFIQTLRTYLENPVTMLV